MNIAQLLISVGTILLAARIFGWLFEHIGQPRVIGEMVAGIVLGPSLLGYLWPAALAYIFPFSVLTSLSTLSQLGVLFFMFIVGLEVDLNEILHQRIMVVLTSNFSILVPFLSGLGLAWLLYPEFAGAHVRFSYFALFVGIAMSITAFPVLARILQERNLLGTNLGKMAISCAAIDDVSAWLLLAILTATVHSQQNWGALVMTFVKFLLFLAFMLLPGRRAMDLLKRSYQRYGLSPGVLSIVILLILIASWVTEKIGVHALFGAFVAGLIVPKESGLVKGLIAKLESVTLVLLLPLFFALTGLRTRIDLISGSRMWLWVLVIIVVATVGKFTGASVTSYAMGMRWRDSAALGILMNTRGLVELVVLNVGLNLGLLSPSLFTMMVLMALVATFMTTLVLIAMKVVPARQSRSSRDSRFEKEVALSAETGGMSVIHPNG